MPARTCPGCGLRLAIAARFERETIDCPRCGAPLSPPGEGPKPPARAAPGRDRAWDWPRPRAAAGPNHGQWWRRAALVGLLGVLLGVTDLRPPEPGRRPPPPAPPTPELGRGPLAFLQPNPFPEGTQVRLGKPREFPVSGTPLQLAFSTRHGALFVRGEDHTVSVLDLGDGEWRPEHRLTGRCLTDMSLSPDESALFVADHGGERAGGKVAGRHRVHRFDLAARRWSTRDAPRAAARIEAVDGFHFVLLGEHRFAPLTFNRWERDPGEITQRGEAGGFHGLIAYDPWAGRLYHAFREGEFLRLTVYRLEEEGPVAGRTRSIEGLRTPSATNSRAAVLSVDGRWLYLGTAQLDTRQDAPPREFGGRIVAASRDLAFGKGAAYDARTGEPIPQALPRTEVYAVSRDGRCLWAFDPRKKVLCQIPLEGKEG